MYTHLGQSALGPITTPEWTRVTILYSLYSRFPGEDPNTAMQTSVAMDAFTLESEYLGIPSNCKVVSQCAG